MSDRYFLDTNIFVYCFDDSNRQKQKLAKSLVEKSLRDRKGFISTQVIQEFLNVATRKFAAPMSTDDAILYLERVLAPLCDVFTSLQLYKEALSVRREAGFSFYDALIVAAAITGDAGCLYSEDLNAGQKIRGVFIKNPFVE